MCYPITANIDAQTFKTAPTATTTTVAIAISSAYSPSTVFIAPINIKQPSCAACADSSTIFSKSFFISEVGIMVYLNVVDTVVFVLSPTSISSDETVMLIATRPRLRSSRPTVTIPFDTDNPSDLSGSIYFSFKSALRSMPSKTDNFAESSWPFQIARLFGCSDFYFS